MTENALLAVATVKAGGEFDKEQAEESVQKISLYYSKQGYLATEVNFGFDLQAGTLKFSIKEGSPPF